MTTSTTASAAEPVLGRSRASQTTAKEHERPASPGVQPRRLQSARRPGTGAGGVSRRAYPPPRNGPSAQASLARAAGETPAEDADLHLRVRRRYRRRCNGIAAVSQSPCAQRRSPKLYQ